MDLSFEYALRALIRTYMRRLETITDGYTSSNSIKFHGSSERSYWSVTVGKTWGSTTTSEGEVLEVLIDEAVRHHESTTNNKLALLTAPVEEKVEDSAVLAE